MRIVHRLIAATVLVALSCVLAGCGTNGSFDPTDMMDFFDTKKKLPGERKPVFPEGVPGVEQGVPRELYRGAQQQNQDVPPVAAAPLPPEPKSKKGATRTAARSVAPVERVQPGEIDQQPEPAPGAPTVEGNVSAAPPAPPAKRTAKRRSITAPPPDSMPQATQQSAPVQQQSSSSFPAPLPTGGFQR